MTERNVSKLNEMGFKCIGGNYVGKVNGLFLEICDNQSAENEFFISFSYKIDGSKTKLLEFLENKKIDSVICNYNLSDEKIEISYSESVEDDLNSFIEELCSVVNEVGIKCKCENCSSTEELSYYSNGSKYLLLCGECASKVKASFEEEKNGSNNYFKGFLGSLVGALIGSVVWIALGAAGFIASFAAIAISYCAFKGYEKMKGRLSVTGIILNVVSIIIAFLFAEYVGLYIGLKKEIAEFTFVTFVHITPAIFSNTGVIKELIPDFAIGILFAVLGSYRTIVDNYRIAKNRENFKIEKVEF